jgi:uncharacterized cofD-like protein
MKKIVVIGGGSGLSMLLRGLKKYDFDISAIVTMTDDGKSTGILRQQFGSLPQGDIRRCIAALSDEEEILTKLFEYRFKRGKGLSGHALGNLILLAMQDICGSFERGIAEFSRILEAVGHVYPSTLENTDLVAILKSGRVVRGESRITRSGHRDPIKTIKLTKKVKPSQDAIYAIKNASAIIIGPGSLYTSIIPNFLIAEITRAVVRNRQAKKIYICNVSTERGETEKFGVADHIDTLIKYAHPKIFDMVLVNNRIVHANSDEGKLGTIKNITTDQEKIGRYKIINADMVNLENPLFHDSKRLAKKIAAII